MTDQQPVVQMPVQLHVQAQPLMEGPGARPRVGLVLGMGAMAMQIQMDAEQAPGLGDLISKVLREAADQAKQDATGLVVPRPGDVPRINGERLG